MRDFRIGIYTHRTELIQKNYKLLKGSSACQRHVPMDPFLQVFNAPFDEKWLKSFHPGIKLQTLTLLLLEAIDKMQPDEEALTCALEEDFLKAIPKDEKDAFYSILATRLILGGRIKEARNITAMIGGSDSGYTGGLTGWILFMEGKNEESLKSYEADLKYYRRKIGGPTDYFHGMAGIFFILAQLKAGDKGLLPKIGKLIKKAQSYSLQVFVHPADLSCAAGSM